MPRNGAVFQDHHAIEQETLECSLLVKALSTCAVLLVANLSHLTIDSRQHISVAARKCA
jgi:hypothetical protein